MLRTEEYSEGGYARFRIICPPNTIYKLYMRCGFDVQLASDLVVPKRYIGYRHFFSTYRVVYGLDMISVGGKEELVEKPTIIPLQKTVPAEKIFKLEVASRVFSLSAMRKYTIRILRALHRPEIYITPFYTIDYVEISDEYIILYTKCDYVEKIDIVCGEAIIRTDYIAMYPIIDILKRKKYYVQPIESYSKLIGKDYEDGVYVLAKRYTKNKNFEIVLIREEIEYQKQKIPTGIYFIESI